MLVVLGGLVGGVRMGEGGEGFPMGVMLCIDLGCGKDHVRAKSEAL